MSSSHPGRKEKIEHELKEMLVLFLYLAVLFCGIVTYNMLLLAQYQVEYWNFAFALINALVITKVIMIGDLMKLGKMHDDKPLLLRVVWKAFIYGLLVFAFHVVEEIIKRLIHGAEAAHVSREMHLEQLAARSILAFLTFIPLFAFREFRRVIGDEKFDALVYGIRREEPHTA
jgi:hypothetical protein